MHTILHFIGLCPDSGLHLDLIDFFAVYYPELPYTIEGIKLTINKIKMKKTLLILAAAMVLTSCNSSTPKTETKNDSDSVVVIVDTVQPCCAIDTNTITDSVK